MGIIGIFLPGMLILLGTLPFWDTFRTRVGAQAAMRCVKRRSRWAAGRCFLQPYMVYVGEDDRGFCPRAFQCSSLDRFPHTTARCGHLHCDRWDRAGDSRAGCPLVAAPRSVTVAASSCTEAGLLATLAMLEGAGARTFLESQGVRHWILQ